MGKYSGHTPTLKVRTTISYTTKVAMNVRSTRFDVTILRKSSKHWGVPKNSDGDVDALSLSLYTYIYIYR